jgi:hypothetical protein
LRPIAESLEEIAACTRCVRDSSSTASSEGPACHFSRAMSQRHALGPRCSVRVALRVLQQDVPTFGAFEHSHTISTIRASSPGTMRDIASSRTVCFRGSSHARPVEACRWSHLRPANVRGIVADLRREVGLPIRVVPRVGYVLPIS